MDDCSMQSNAGAFACGDWGDSGVLAECGDVNKRSGYEILFHYIDVKRSTYQQS